MKKIKLLSTVLVIILFNNAFAQPSARLNSSVKGPVKQILEQTTYKNVKSFTEYNFDKQGRLESIYIQSLDTKKIALIEFYYNADNTLKAKEVTANADDENEPIGEIDYTLIEYTPYSIYENAFGDAIYPDISAIYIGGDFWNKTEYTYNINKQLIKEIEYTDDRVRTVEYNSKGEIQKITEKLEDGNVSVTTYKDNISTTYINGVKQPEEEDPGCWTECANPTTKKDVKGRIIYSGCTEDNSKYTYNTEDFLLTSLRKGWDDSYDSYTYSNYAYDNYQNWTKRTVDYKNAYSSNYWKVIREITYYTDK